MGAAHEIVLRCRSNTRPWFLLLALLGCAASHSRAADPDPDDPDKASGEFEGDLPDGLDSPFGLTQGGGEVELDYSVSGYDGPSWDDAAQVVGQADVVQLEGNRLYALSRMAGLSVIDVSNPDSLRILGRCRALPAEPRAMYVRDGVAIAVFSGWGQYAANDAGDYEWVLTSKVLALAVADPSEIVALGSVEVPGTIDDSRIASDVLYLVAHQDGECWGCEQGRSRTAVLSLDVSDPRDLRQVDELTFDDTTSPTDNDGPSIAFAEQRLYVAGLAHGAPDPQGSIIQVIDISDPAGHMVLGDSVEIAERVSSPEKMDEYDGVLRVISQPPQWDPAHPPRVQTFRVVSSADLQPLGSTTLGFPRMEQAHGVHFDGARAYAFPFSFDQTDRLFTIDLSDPAQPVQAATLEMGGRNLLHHIHPRGDRLLGLSIDPDNTEGASTVALYDVSDLANPSLIDRVGFGSGSSAFQVLAEAGLILVPIGGSDLDDASGQAYCSIYQGGVQLVDVVGDTLTVRGKARVDNDVRRALLLEDRLLTVSDKRVEAFDITDRDAPRSSGKLLLARKDERAYPLDNGSVARLHPDWSSASPSIDFVAVSEADEPNASLGALDLHALGVDSFCQEPGLGMPGWFPSVPRWVLGAFARGNQVEILYQSEDELFYGLAIIDGSDPTAPKVLSNTTWAYEEHSWWDDYYSGYGYGYYGDQKALVRTDSAIVMLERRSEGGNHSERLHVVDVSDPSAPSSTLLDLPGTQQHSGLVAVGDAVLTSHFEVSDGSTGRARFYLDRFDLSDPTRLVQADPVNIPGALMHVDAASGDLLTSELVRQQSQADTTEECYKRYAFPEHAPEVATNWGGPAAPCVGYTQRVHLVSVDAGVATLEDTLTFEDDEHVRSVAAGDGVVFASIGFEGYYYDYDGFYYDSATGAFTECYDSPCGYGGSGRKPGELLTLAGFGKGRLEAGRITVDSQDAWHGFWGTPGVYAAGTRALLMSQDELAIVDATDAAKPTLVRTEPAYGAPHSVQISGTGQALLTLSPAGLQRVDLR